MTTTGVFDDTVAMIIVAVGVVLMFVFIWLLMRKYKQEHCAYAMQGTASHVPTLPTSGEATPVRPFADTYDVVGSPAAEPDVLQRLPSWITSPASEAGQIPLSVQPPPHAEFPPAITAEEKPKRRGSSGKKHKESPDTVAADLHKQPSSRDQPKPKSKKSDHGNPHGIVAAASPAKRKTKRKQCKSTASRVTLPGTTSPPEPQAKTAASAALQPEGGAVATHAQLASPSGAEDPQMQELRAAVAIRRASRVSQFALKPERRKPSVHQLDIFSADHSAGNSAETEKPETSSRESPTKITGFAALSAVEAPTLGAGPSSQSKSPDDEDSVVKELRTLHLRRASRVPQASSSKECQKVDVSKVPDMLDIFSAEHSTL
ncbi:uncharacterized protein LOC144101679 [Amblyomma americanum]